MRQREKRALGLWKGGGMIKQPVFGRKMWISSRYMVRYFVCGMRGYITMVVDSGQNVEAESPIINL